MPKKPVKSLRILLDPDLYTKAKVKAARTGVAMAEICRRALEEWIADEPLQKPQQKRKGDPKQ